MKNVLIIGAMEDTELGYLITKLRNYKENRYKGFCFYEGELVGMKAIICASGIGLINASICTTIGIELYKPDLVINIGLVRRICRRFAWWGYCGWH